MHFGVTELRRNRNDPGGARRVAVRDDDGVVHQASCFVRVGTGLPYHRDRDGLDENERRGGLVTSKDTLRVARRQERIEECAPWRERRPERVDSGRGRESRSTSGRVRWGLLRRDNGGCGDTQRECEPKDERIFENSHLITERRSMRASWRECM